MRLPRLSWPYFSLTRAPASIAERGGGGASAGREASIPAFIPFAAARPSWPAVFIMSFIGNIPLQQLNALFALLFWRLNSPNHAVAGKGTLLLLRCRNACMTGRFSPGPLFARSAPVKVVKKTPGRITHGTSEEGPTTSTAHRHAGRERLSKSLHAGRRERRFGGVGHPSRCA